MKAPAVAGAKCRGRSRGSPRWTSRNEGPGRRRGEAPPVPRQRCAMLRCRNEGPGRRRGEGQGCSSRDDRVLAAMKAPAVAGAKSHLDAAGQLARHTAAMKAPAVAGAKHAGTDAIRFRDRMPQ